MSEATETRAVDPSLAERLAGPALPFAGDAGAVPVHLLGAPEGEIAVPTAALAVPWRQAGALRLTVVVKATFALTAPRLAPAAAAEPIHRVDQHHKGQPLAHVIAAGDRVPWKTAADVTLVGHAHAPRPVPEMMVRFALRAGERTLLDKGARIVGHRIAAGAAPKPFTSMPVVYERAHGGAGTPANPIGCGEGGAPPNIVDPVSPYRPAGFGPIAAAWPLRHRRLGDTPRAALEGRIIELPPSIDWAYFQSAPPDQVLWELPADAVIVLEGLLPGAPRFEAQLPSARAVGAVYGRGEDPDEPAELSFHADTLHVDADRGLVTLAFRAYLDLRDEAALDRVAVAAGVGLGDRTPTLPARRPAALRSREAPLPAPVAARIGTGTLAADSGDLAAIIAAAINAPPASPPLAPPPIAFGGPSTAAPITVGQRAALGRPPKEAAREASDLGQARESPPPEPRVEAPPAPPRPEELVDLERYATLLAAIEEPGAGAPEVLDAHGVKGRIYREAAAYWRRALDVEIKHGRSAQRDLFDEAYVAAWEKAAPGRFGAAHYARLARAEERGLLQIELEKQGIALPIGMRLRRVWRRRISVDAALRAEVEEAKAERITDGG